MLVRVFAMMLLSVVACAPIAVAEENFSPLFDGQSLTGWVQRGGKAKYFVE